jgi:putative ABC transport system permease protein
MQLGFSEALYSSAVRLHRSLAGDIVLVSPQYTYLAISRPFSQRRLFQAQAYAAVESATPIYFALAPWRNPTNGHTRNILVLGVDPTKQVLNLPELSEELPRTRVLNRLLFDIDSRSEYGFENNALASGHHVPVELAQRRMFVDGTFALGTSFAVDGSVIASVDTFLDLFPYRRAGIIDIGIVRLRPGANVEAVRSELASRLPNDVEVLTKQGFIDREQAYWRQNTPIGYVFTFGVVMGLVVGAVIVYLVLFVNVAERLSEFATLKAIGFADRALLTVVLQQSLILAGTGFVIGLSICSGLYSLAAKATLLPLALSMPTAALVLGLTVLMCGVSGAAALLKVRAADPAEVFA